MSIVDDSMSSYKQNRELRRRNSPFQKMEDNYTIKARRSKMKFRVASEAERASLRKQLLKRNAKDKRIRILLLVGLVISVGIIFWVFLFQLKLF
ncbi:MAG: hypothetical protein AAFO69_02105 [Bacteroidota bacterium]